MQPGYIALSKEKPQSLYDFQNIQLNYDSLKIIHQAVRDAEKEFLENQKLQKQNEELSSPPPEEGYKDIYKHKVLIREVGNEQEYTIDKIKSVSSKTQENKEHEKILPPRVRKVQTKIESKFISTPENQYLLPLNSTTSKSVANFLQPWKIKKPKTNKDDPHVISSGSEDHTSDLDSDFDEEEEDSRDNESITESLIEDITNQTGKKADIKHLSMEQRQMLLSDNFDGILATFPKDWDLAKLRKELERERKDRLLGKDQFSKTREKMKMEQPLMIFKTFRK